MGKSKRVIYDSRDLDNISDDMIKGIDKAITAVAFKVRDRSRQKFKSSKSLYKYSTNAYDSLAAGIEIGKLKHKGSSSSEIPVHAMGSVSSRDTYKTRFFVGGTMYRKQTKKAGKQIKPHSKGYIKPNNAIEKGISGAEQILNTYIDNVLNK